MADSSAKSVDYVVTADGSGFVKAMETMSSAASGAAGEIQKKFEGIGKAFEAVQKTLLVLTAVVGGGAFFKGAIDASNKLTGETVLLSKRLGITAEQAGVLNTALGAIGSDADTYVGAFDKFAKQIKKNEAGLQDMGLQTRDANGNLRDSNELFTEALAKVGTYKAGLDQNIAAQTLFGKSVAEVMALQKLNNDVLEKAREKNEALGLTITQGNVEASKKYRLAMEDVSLVLTAVQKVVGDAVMPIFTELAEYFAETGPYVVGIFRVAILGVELAFRVLQATVKTVVALISETINHLVDQVGNFSDLLKAVFSGDFSGAADIFDKMKERYAQGIRNVVDAAKDAFHDAQTAFANDVDRAMTKGVGAGKQGKSGANTIAEKDPKAAKSRDAEWQTELDEKKLHFQEERNLEGSFEEFGKEAEAAFWKDKLALTTAGSAENLALRKRIAELQLAIGRGEFDAELESLKAKEEAYRHGSQERMNILVQEAELIKQRYGEQSKEYEAAQKAIVAEARATAEQLKKIDEIRVQARRNAQLAELALEEQHAQLERDLGLITNQQLLEQQMAFEQKRYDIAYQALQDRLALAALDPVEAAKVNADIEALEQQHVLRMGQIQNSLTKDMYAPLVATQKAAEQAIASSIQGIINGTMSLRTALANIWKSISSTIVGEIAKIIAQKVAAWAVEKALALAGIGAKASEAGAGAASAVADIPIVGPVLAIAAMAATFAAVMGMKSNVPSAAGGYDIPYNVNPLTQLHAGEMVLPAKQADVIRRLAEGQQPATAAGGASTVEIKATPIPGNFFVIHAAELAKGMKAANRSGSFWTP